jgi:hypothetical protein
MERFSRETERELRSAGWVPGRQIDISKWVDLLTAEGYRVHSAAERFLSEFGGIAINVSGPGLTMAREPFSLYPTSCSGEADRILDWSSVLGKNFFPIGEYGPRRFFLVIDEAAEVYLMMDWVAALGAGDRALENLVRGVAPVLVAE